MPLEIRTSDGRHWARPVVQNHPPLPLVRTESPFERRRRRRRGLATAAFLFALGWLALALSAGALS